MKFLKKMKMQSSEKLRKKMTLNKRRFLFAIINFVNARANVILRFQCLAVDNTSLRVRKHFAKYM